MKDFILIVICVILINALTYLFFDKLDSSYVNRGIAAGYIEK